MNVLRATRTGFAVLSRHVRNAGGRPHRLWWIARRVFELMRERRIGKLLARNAPPGDVEQAYAAWIARYDTLDDAGRARLRAILGGLARRASFTLILNRTGTPEQRAATIASLDAQLYPHWRLVESAAHADARAAAVLAAGNGADSTEQASRAAEPAAHARHDGYVALLAPGDRLAEDALLRIAQALAAHDRARAGLRPTLEGKLGIDDEAYAGGRARQRTRRRAGASVDWEPDVFGRLNGAREARGAEAWARVHEAEDFRLRLSVDVADTYLGIVEQRWLLDLLDAQMGTANELGRIIAQRYDEGLISQLDVLQQQTQIAELEGQIPVARAALEDLQNRLGALLGALPGDAVVTGAGEGAPLPEIGSLPRLERADELLRRRPDLRASQAALVAADAETARALAERLPRLTLSADALRVETGGGPAIKTISLGAELVQPLLDWGARRAEWVRTKAVYRERLAAFSQDFLGAVWEVEALIQNERRQHELLESLARRRVLLETTIKQARSRYDAGLTDYLPVLSATQQFYAVEQRLVRERRRRGDHGRQGAGEDAKGLRHGLVSVVHRC